ncbi:MAG: glutamine amidotransferase [bacterium]
MVFSAIGYQEILFIAVIVLILFFLHKRLNKMLYFFFFRLIIFLSLIFMFFEPQRVVYDDQEDKPNVAVMIDTSKSMNIKDPDKRIDKVNQFINSSKNLFGKNIQTYFYPFSESSSRVDSDKLNVAGAEGESTDIASVIAEVGRELRGKLAAGVLISDGGHNTSGDPLQEAKSFGAPIYCLGVGSSQGAPDLAVAELNVSDFAFKNTPIEIDCTVKSYGFDGKKIQVTLNEGNELISQKTVIVKGERYIKQIKFKYIPKKVGNFQYTISIPVLQGEATSKNNKKHFMLDIVREKLRVLYICGQPSYEYASLRRVLKSDPSIELVSFVILRNPENIPFVPDNQLSLIPFPAQEIFMEKLFNFDLLIFENFTYTRFGFFSAYLSNIKNYVLDKGGSFLMIGGENSFGLGRYNNTPIEDILPVVTAGVNEEYMDEFFELEIDKLKHPIMALSDAEGENRKIWSEMPKLEGYNRFIGLKPGAINLAVEKKSGSPVISVWDKGKGRVMAVATNTTWRWSMGLSKEGKTPLYYNRFWRRAVRWLTRADKMKLVLLSLNKRQYVFGEKMLVKILVSDKSYQPLSKARVELEVVSPSQNRVDVPVYESGPGEYVAEVRLEQLGTYILDALAFDPRDTISQFPLGRDKRAVEVIITSKEDETLQLNRALLLEIADESGGLYSHINDFNIDLLEEFIRAKGKKQIKEKIQFWNSPYIYIIFIILLGIEWFWRRRKGLL